MVRIMRNMVLAACLALTLSACGKKSDLQKPLPPPDSPKEEKEGAPAHRPFILDPLLR